MSKACSFHSGPQSSPRLIPFTLSSFREAPHCLSLVSNFAFRISISSRISSFAFLVTRHSSLPSPLSPFSALACPPQRQRRRATPFHASLPESAKFLPSSTLILLHFYTLTLLCRAFPYLPYALPPSLFFSVAAPIRPEKRRGDTPRILQSPPRQEFQNENPSPNN